MRDDTQCARPSADKKACPNAGWDLLVQLADEAGDKEAKREFKKRLHEEEDHLLFVRKAVEKFAFKEVLGEDVKMPKSTINAMLT